MVCNLYQAEAFQELSSITYVKAAGMRLGRLSESVIFFPQSILSHFIRKERYLCKPLKPNLGKLTLIDKPPKSYSWVPEDG